MGKLIRKWVIPATVLFFIWLAFISTDIILVSNNKQPVFTIRTGIYDDGGSAVYLGIGYKIIKYVYWFPDKPAEVKYAVGTWLLKFDKYGSLSAPNNNITPDMTYPQVSMPANSFIKETIPVNNYDNFDTTQDIVIYFKDKIDEASLEGNVSVYLNRKEITNLLDFDYDSVSRKLTISTIIKGASISASTGNIINVVLSGYIVNSSGKRMNEDFRFCMRVGVSNSNNVQDWDKGKSMFLFREKYCNNRELIQDDDVDYEEIDYIYGNKLHGFYDGTSIRIVSILPKEYAENDVASYEIGGYRLSLQRQGNPSVTGIFVILNNKYIYTLDEAINDFEHPLSMIDIYPLLPIRFSNVEFTSPDEGSLNELTSISGQLLNRNVLTQQIFIHGFLPRDAENKVISDKFKAYADIEDFIRNTYIKKMADILLELHKGYYYDLDGTLYFDPYAVKGRDYQSIWDDFTFRLSDFKEYSVKITANRRYFQFGVPGHFYGDVEFTMIKENGKWLLTAMME